MLPRKRRLSSSSLEDGQHVPRRRLFSSSSEDDESYQVGGAVVTRRQQKKDKDLSGPQNNRTESPMPSTSAAAQENKENEKQPGEKEKQQNETEENENETQSQENQTLDKIDGLSKLFRFPEQVFENETYTITIQKQEHIKQKVFRLEDHLFVMRVKLHEGKTSPYLLDIRSVLENCMEKMIDEIRSELKLKDNETVAIYITIAQPGIFNSIRSGAFDLKKTDSKTITHFLMNMFNRFCHSQNHLKLTDGFKVYFKLFGYEHIKWSGSRMKPIKELGSGCQTNKQTNNGTVDLRAEVQPVFENFCLIYSVLIAHYSNLKHEVGDSCYDILSSLWDETATEEATTSACLLLFELIEEVIFKLNLAETGPYNAVETLPLLSQFFESQIHLIKSCQEKKVLKYSVPNFFNSTKRQIFLSQPTEDHVVPIVSMVDYTTTNKSFCLLCGLTYYVRSVHTCKLKKFHCKSCRRIKGKTKGTQLIHHGISICNSPLKTISQQIIHCDTCNLDFHSSDCYGHHLKICCYRYFFCPKCKKIDKNVKSEQNTQVHVCAKDNERNCYYCKKNYPKDSHHKCNLKEDAMHKKWPKMIFFSFYFMDSDYVNCVSCLKLRKNSEKNEDKNNRCELHCVSLENDCANACTVWEETERGTFLEHFFCDDSLKITASTNTFHFNYQTESQTPPFVTRKTGNLLYDTANAIKKIALKKEKMVQDYFIEFLLNEKRRNSVWLSLNPNNENMPFIMTMLLTMNIVPKVVKRNNRFILLKILCHNISFLNASNFFEGTYEDLHSEFQIDDELIFFPQR